jgi:hypothetical protein
MQVRPQGHLVCAKGRCEVTPIRKTTERRIARARGAGDKMYTERVSDTLSFSPLEEADALCMEEADAVAASSLRNRRENRKHVLSTAVYFFSAVGLNATESFGDQNKIK